MFSEVFLGILEQPIPQFAFAGNVLVTASGEPYTFGQACEPLRRAWSVPEKLSFPPELIAAAQANDEEALETLAVRITGQVLVFVRAARNRGHYTFVAERSVIGEQDIVQDVCIKVFTNLAACDTARFGGWLRKIIENHLISVGRWREAQLRDHRRTKSLDEPLPGSESDTDQRTLRDMQVGSDGVEEIACSERSGQAQLFIDSIENPKHREIVVLHYFEGFTHEQIAQMTGMSPGGVGAALSRAMKRMQRSVQRIGL